MIDMIAKGNDFSRFDNDKTLTFTREDKNGTRYYVDHVCPKCHGAGYLREYGHIEGGVCFMCEGSGQYDMTIRVLTEDYDRKLTERRQAKLRKDASKVNAEWCKRNGFSEDFKTWVILGETYSIKEDLKAAGAKWSNLIGWHLPEKPEAWPSFELAGDQVIREEEDYKYTVLDFDFAGRVDWTNYYSALSAYVKTFQDAYLNSSAAGEYVGQVGTRATFSLTYDDYRAFSGFRDNATFIYMFHDKDGNSVIWKTTNYQELTSGSEYTITGTVKEHAEYRGRKQTSLTRCKIA